MLRSAVHIFERVVANGASKKNWIYANFFAIGLSLSLANHYIDMIKDGELPF